MFLSFADKINTVDRGNMFKNFAMEKAFLLRFVLSTVLVLFFPGLQQPTFVHCTNLTQVQQLVSSLFNDYNKKLFQLMNHSNSVNISITVFIVSLNNFDEISGALDITAIFYLAWNDERFAWDPSAYGGKTSVLTHTEDIWKPQLYVIQSFDKLQEIGNISLYPRIWYNGTITWNPGIVMKVTCSVDVTYFPFDVQSCPIIITAWSYTKAEVKLITSQTSVDTSFFSLNSQWELLNSSIGEYTTNRDMPPSIVIQLSLKRRSHFFIVYIIVPILFLGLMNNLVFLMPVSSGERTSVAVTIFLSFVVYMEMVNNTVPESSSPVAYIYYYIMFLLVYSSVILFLCIISLRIHDSKIQVPEKLKVLVMYLRCWCLTRIYSEQKVTPKRIKSIEADNGENDTPHTNIIVDKPVQTDVTWHVVADTFDKYIMILMYIFFVGFSVSTFVNLYTNQGF